ncbi:MAG: hypothetical protein M0Z65_11700 [Firmicutes bacterium]|uniref:Uncharacterized protein n=1 Tax=Melghirimyces thermohalophilus TaxID=1236220 RepID=A0A1G6NV08_9BACL|nr:hypothetical protein [Melghirimyces thermohalophilus]MDA8353817.1 hypothetical protein [Bacillota bacterium]SDC71783.1 hypothetical protein SAMN04488112_11458 [Melghirimyces thermohalophilus]
MTEKQEEQFRLLTVLKGVNASMQQIAWLLDDPQYDKEYRMLRQTLIDGSRMMGWLLERLKQETGRSGEDHRLGEVDQTEKQRILLEALEEQVSSYSWLLGMLDEEMGLKEEKDELRWLKTQMRRHLRRAEQKLPNPVDSFLDHVLNVNGKYKY